MAKEKEIVDLTENKSGNIVGMDVGTGNFVAATRDGDNLTSNRMRNMYLPIPKDGSFNYDLSKLRYVESDEYVYILGEDAYNFANIWGKPVERPMQSGLIAASNVDALDVMTLMIENMVGRTKNGLAVYSVPAESVDKDNSILYHEGVFKRIFNELGYRAIPFNEAMGVVYSELQDTDFTGLAFSYGAGMSNVALSYKSNAVLQFSVARGGDWIDNNVATQFATTPNRITTIKENNTDLSNYKTGRKKERQIREAIIFYYKDLIRYTLNQVKLKLDEELSDVDLPDEIPIVISGGTSMAKGFLELFKSVIDDYDEFPFDISSINYAGDQLTSVAEGMLIKAISESGE